MSNETTSDFAADIQEKRELFVANLSKQQSENDVVRIFGAFGNIEKCNLPRDECGLSKGYAFVTFSKHEEAQLALNKLHRKQTMPGANGGILVEFAESEREKHTRKRKLFVANLNKQQNDEDLRRLFEPFGAITQCEIIRDECGNCMGYAFIKFSTHGEAQLAINKLHGKHIIPGAPRSIFVDFADSMRNQRREKRKLFVGPLSKQQNDDDVRRMFEVFGDIKECIILRDEFGNSKSCAFVKFSTEEEALLAIKTMHGKQTMSGASSSLAVMFADAKRKRDTRRLTTTILDQSIRAKVPLNALQEIQAYQASTTGEVVSALNNPYTTLTHHVHCIPVKQMEGTKAHILNDYQGSSTVEVDSALNNPYTTFTHNVQGMPVQQMENTNAHILSGCSGPTNIHYSANRVQLCVKSTLTLSRREKTKKTILVAFIQEIGDSELAKLFMPFGTVISAKVYMDRTINQSKCFGFVKFDNPNSANAAIQGMNGFQIGKKRLRVELKRSKSDVCNAK